MKTTAKMSPETAYAINDGVREIMQSAKPGFAIETVRVVRRFERYDLGNEGRTIGQQIDHVLSLALDHGEEMQDIAVHFEKSDWTALRELHEGN